MTYEIERLFNEIEENAIKKGIEQGQVEIVKAMLAAGKPLEKIARRAKLSQEKIKHYRMEG